MNISPKASVTPDVYTDVNGLKSLSKNADNLESLKEVSKQFESMFINMMLKNMRAANAAFEEGNFLNSNESKMFRDMYDNQLSLNLAKGNGIGIAETLFNQLKQGYGAVMGIDGEPSSEKTDSEESNTNTQSGAGSIWDRQKASFKPLDSLIGSESTGAVSKTDDSAQSVKKVEQVKEPDFNSPLDFVERLYPQIKKVLGAVGVNPLVVLAQSALETGWGQHVSSEENGASSNNLFNIKADGRWEGERVAVNTLEFKDGVALQEKAQFRKYQDFMESIGDYVRFLHDNPRYETALQKKTDAQAFAVALQDAGYATDPLYAKKVMDVMDSIKPMLNRLGME